MPIIDVAVRQENFNFCRTATIYALEKQSPFRNFIRKTTPSHGQSKHYAKFVRKYRGKYGQSVFTKLSLGVIRKLFRSIHSSAYRSGDFWPIQVREVSKFIENERFR